MIVLLSGAISHFSARPGSGSVVTGLTRMQTLEQIAVSWPEVASVTRIGLKVRGSLAIAV